MEEQELFLDLPPAGPCPAQPKMQPVWAKVNGPCSCYPWLACLLGSWRCCCSVPRRPGVAALKPPTGLPQNQGARGWRSRPMGGGFGGMMLVCVGGIVLCSVRVDLSPSFDPSLAWKRSPLCRPVETARHVYMRLYYGVRWPGGNRPQRARRTLRARRNCVPHHALLPVRVTLAERYPERARVGGGASGDAGSEHGSPTVGRLLDLGFLSLI